MRRRPGRVAVELRVLELAPTPSPEDVALPESATDVGHLGWRELQVIVAEIRAEMDGVITTAVPVICPQRRQRVGASLRTPVRRRTQSRAVVR